MPQKQTVPLLKIHRPPEKRAKPMKQYTYKYDRVLKVLSLARGGFTDEELAFKAGGNKDTVRLYRRDLMQLGYVEDSGTKRAVSGRRHGFTVWAITAKGRKKAAQLSKEKANG